MSMHYNGFISYRHCDLDSRIASEVQRQLEHYHIPKAVRDKTGIKKLDRVFLDKEELPVTSDINMDISGAIRNSDFLIVICSPRTMESQWVMREILLFLEDHPKNRVLTVLAEGDPSETIPDILRYQDIENSVTGEPIRLEIEPLSSDYRIPLKKAAQTELPRLAAPMLGVSYDELRQRQHQYELRKKTALLGSVAAVMALFMAYFAYSNMKLDKSYEEVRANYERSLINQSEYLAAESEKALENNDRMLAIELALEALPSEGNDRPEVASAVAALEDSIEAYVPAAVGVQQSDSYELDSTVKGMDFSTDGKYLYAYDDSNQLYIWDIVNRKCLRKIPAGIAISNFKLVGDKYLFVSGDLKTKCYDALSGELIRSIDGSSYTVTAIPGTDEVLLTGDVQVLRLNLETNETVSASSKDFWGEKIWIWASKDACFSPDGRYAALQSHRYTENEAGSYDELYEPVILDLSDNSLHLLTHPYGLILGMAFTPDGSLLTFGYPVGTDIIKLTLQVTGSFTYKYHNTLLIERFAPGAFAEAVSGAKPEWTTSVDSMDVVSFSGLEVVDGGEHFYAVAGNKILYCSAGDGRILKTAETDGRIIYEWIGSGKPHMITENGCWANYELNKEYMAETAVFKDELRLAYAGNGYFTVSAHDRKILRYNTLCDEEFREWDTTAADLIEDDIIGDDFVCLLNYDYTLHWLDAASCSELWSVDLREEAGGISYAVRKLLGLSEDGTHVLVYMRTGVYPDCRDEIYSVDIATGGVSVTDLKPAKSIKGIWLHKGRIYYAYEDYSEDTVSFVSFRDDLSDLSESAAAAADTSGISAYINDGSIIVLDGRCTFYDSDGNLYISDLETGETRDTGIDLNLQNTLQCWNEEETLMAVAGCENVLLLDGSGSVLKTLDEPSATLRSLAFSPYGPLLVLQDKGRLDLYDADGEFIKRIDTCYSNGIIDYSWQFPDEDTVINIAGISGGCGRTDLKTGSVRDNVRNGIAWIRSTNSYLSSYTSSGQKIHIGSYPVYSTERLIEKGREILGDIRMDGDARRAYGLD